MQQYMKAQDLVEKENIHQIHALPKPRVRHPVSGPLKAKVAQPVEKSSGLEQDEEESDPECAGGSCQEE
eukprot:9440684-Prorocentrum_lima.AAC.1